MSESSPLPWKADNGYIQDADDRDILTWCLGRLEVDANIALIVRAVNCHAELLVALKACSDSIEIFGCEDEDIINGPTLRSARAAIAKAEGNAS
jgi:hypothetical protein